jgi:histidinol-phosphate/aromatic aminotransferase/cobyric acid decarboxylase-like protein
MLYCAFSPHGFIRRIASKQNFTLVEFDTVEDAEKVFNACKRKGEVIIDRTVAKISYARYEHRVYRQNLSVRLADILPEGHKLWRQLQKIASDHET